MVRIAYRHERQAPYTSGCGSIYTYVEVTRRSGGGDACACVRVCLCVSCVLVMTTTSKNRLKKHMVRDNTSNTIKPILYFNKIFVPSE